MKLDCYPVDETPIDVRPAEHRRDWMDATGNAFAYRCLPLTIANTHGWEIRCPVSFEARWSGGDAAEDVTVTSSEATLPWVDTHFGYGILTFNPKAIFRTEAGYNLWVMGPPNSPKDGVQALAAVIETDWMPYSFTMNWKFTRPGVAVRFEKGEPYCFLFPVRRGAVEEFRPAIRRLDEEPRLEEQCRQAYLRRTFVQGVQKITGHLAAPRLFQGWYMKGETPDGKERFEDHQKALQVSPFSRNE